MMPQIMMALKSSSSLRLWGYTSMKTGNLGPFTLMSICHNMRQYTNSIRKPFLSSPLRGEKMRQFLTSDQETIVCVHPTTEVDISDTMPLRRRNRNSKSTSPLPENHIRGQLSPEEAKIVKQLRFEDPQLWSVQALSKLFNAHKNVIMNIAPPSEARKEWLKKNKEDLKCLRPYKRRVYFAEQLMNRQKRLKELVEENKYNFPGKL